MTAAPDNTTTHAGQHHPHAQQLRELAALADTLTQGSNLNGPWTDTPGTDALRQLHPHLTDPTPSNPAPSNPTTPTASR